MSSSVRSRTPRPAYVRADSSNSIHIESEIRVSSSAADGSSKKAIPGTMHYRPGHDRAQSQGPTMVRPLAPAPALNRGNSMSKMSDTLRHTQVAHDSKDFVNNKQSVRALAEFLMTSQPPSSNFMSRPDSDAGSIHSINKSAFKLFARQKNKRVSKVPKLLQLPDSAVAARTTGGARHIAISIPLEYDFPYYDNPARFSVSASQPRAHSRPPGERGPVVVLKPVAEAREPGSMYLTKSKSDTEVGKDEHKKAPRAESVPPRTAHASSSGITRNTENDSKQLHPQQGYGPKNFSADKKVAMKEEPAATYKSYIAVSPVNFARAESTRTDPRHSGGTAYSTATISSYLAHSRGPSSASSAPSASLISGIQPELPPRTSSVPRFSPAVQTDLAKMCLANKTPAAEYGHRPSLSQGSALSVPESASSGTIIATAETAQSYNAAAGIQTISRGNTPKQKDSSPPTNPVPTRQLADLPESPHISNFHDSQSPPLSGKNFPVVDDTMYVEGNTPPVDITSKDSNQTRKDRVKVRKLRDMAIHRDKSTDGKDPLSETVSSSNSQILDTASPRSAMFDNTHRQESTQKRGYNVMSLIMVVADLAPDLNAANAEDLPYVSSPERAIRKWVKESDSNGTMSARGTHTPPLSPGSETDSMAPARIRSRGRAGASDLDARRQERRAKRNMSLREREVDVRLSKIERDNMMLMSTLNGIANSFGELSRVIPRTAICPEEPALVMGLDRGITDGGNEAMVQAGESA